MFDFIKKLFCDHEWEDITGCVKIYANDYDKLPICYKRTYICKKCLKNKTIRY